MIAACTFTHDKHQGLNTVRQALMFGCDLRAAPRKNLLRFLAEHTANMVERHHLMLLSSRQG